MHWTAETEAAMLESGNEGVHRYYEQLIGQLNDMVYLIRGKLSKMARVTIGALAVIDVHARDVMKKVGVPFTLFKLCICFMTNRPCPTKRYCVAGAWVAMRPCRRADREWRT